MIMKWTCSCVLSNLEGGGAFIRIWAFIRIDTLTKSVKSNLVLFFVLI